MEGALGTSHLGPQCESQHIQVFEDRRTPFTKLVRWTADCTIKLIPEISQESYSLSPASRRTPAEHS